MTWIDERLFGWSRSAKRGTSAWAGDLASRIGTPDESDEEDTGDYEHVVGILPAVGDDQSATSSSKSRSRQNSYADLQKLRLAPFPPTSQTSPLNSGASASPSEDGLTFRNGHRTRRESLTDGIPVSRIAAVDRAEPFTDATQSLNEEASRKKTDTQQ